MPLRRAADGITRKIEQGQQSLLDQGVPAERLKNQLPARALPPASGSARGGVLISDTTPAAVGTATAGVSSAVSRGDHVHSNSSAGGADNYILIEDRKAAGTEGGTFTNGAWQVRDFTTEVVDTGGHASVSANQITLLAGTYRYRITCPNFLVNYNQARLWDVTNAALIASGQNCYSETGQQNALIVGRMTLAGTTVLQVEHRCNVTRATNGFGVALNGQFTVDYERYSIFEAIREA